LLVRPAPALSHLFLPKLGSPGRTEPDHWVSLRKGPGRAEGKPGQIFLVSLAARPGENGGGLAGKDLHQLIPGHVESHTANLSVLNLEEGGAGVHPAPLVLASRISRRILDRHRGAAPWPFADIDDLGVLLVCRHRINSETDFGIGLGKIVDHLSNRRVAYK